MDKKPYFRLNEEEFGIKFREEYKKFMKNITLSPSDQTIQRMFDLADGYNKPYFYDRAIDLIVLPKAVL